MGTFPQTIILRHRKENIKKCSLRGLEGRPDFRFYTYPTGLSHLPPLEEMVCLTFDAPVLSEKDHDCPLLVLDATWAYAAKMERAVFEKGTPIKRSLPKQFKTAYPRVQNDCPDPAAGLASIEAIYIAYSLMGRETHGLLDHYYWKELFLQMAHSATMRSTVATRNDTRENLLASHSKKVYVQTPWRSSASHQEGFDLPKKDKEPLSIELIFQFILHSFLKSNDLISKIATSSTTKKRALFKQLTGNASTYLTQTKESPLQIDPHHLSFPLYSQPGTLGKMLHYANLLKKHSSKRYTIDDKGFEMLCDSIMDTIHTALKCAAIPSKARGEFESTYITLKAHFQKLVELIPNLIVQFSGDETVLLFLFSNHSKVDKLFEKEFVKQTTKKLFPEGLVQAKEFLSLRFAKKGFNHLLPTIEKLTQQIQRRKG